MSPGTGKRVEGYGPLQVPLLVIGEAPGGTEERLGRPFVGATGHFVRACLKAEGIDPESQVRWENVFQYNMGTLPVGRAALDHLISSARVPWREGMQSAISRCTPKVVLLVGRASMLALTGEWGIGRRHGSVWEGRHFPNFPWPNALVIPTIHPAAAMRSEICANLVRCEVAIKRAAAYASGGLVYKQPVVRQRWVTRLDAVVDAELNTCKQGSIVAIDTEYGKDGRAFMVGVSLDGEQVWTFDLRSPRVTETEVGKLLQSILTSQDVTRVFHNFPADVGSLQRAGFEVRLPVVDTMLAQGLLYPDLPASLSSCALFWLDHWEDWKGMQHNDPLYNALDVCATWQVWARQVPALEDAGLMRTLTHEVVPVTVCLMGMQARGLHVDHAVQTRAIDEAKRRRDELYEEIQDAVRRMTTKRGTNEVNSVAMAEEAIAIATSNSVRNASVRCELHPFYTGLRKKRFAASSRVAGQRRLDSVHCTCDQVYASAFAFRDVISAHKAVVTKAKGKLKRWDSRPFDPDNHHDVKWLYYSSEGLGLQPVRSRKKVTSNVDAVAKLMLRQDVKDNEERLRLLNNIREYQRLGKRLSTFYLPDVDHRGNAHPEYRHGTGTGRLAGGSDKDLANEEEMSRGKTINALNIPNEVRSIYVPRPTTDLTRPWPFITGDEDYEDDLEEEESMEEEDAN